MTQIDYSNLIQKLQDILNRIKRLEKMSQGQPVSSSKFGDLDLRYVTRESNLSDLSDFADARENIGLEIGADVQAYSANLDEYAAVNPTPAGLALLDDANAAAQRTTLGLGTMAVESASDYVSTTGDTLTGTLNVVGTVQTDELRLDQTPTVEIIIPDSTIIISVDGTDYKIPCILA